MRARVLQFVTGTSRVPVTGFRDLRVRLRENVALLTRPALRTRTLTPVNGDPACAAAATGLAGPQTLHHRGGAVEQPRVPSQGACAVAMGDCVGGAGRVNVVELIASCVCVRCFSFSA